MRVGASSPSATPPPAWLPVLAFAVSFWVCSAVYLSGSSSFPMQRHLLVGVTSLCASLLIVAFLLLKQPNLVLILALGLFLGLTVSCWGAFRFCVDLESVASEEPKEWTMTVVEDSKEGEFGGSCIAECALSNGRTIKVRVNLPDDVVLDCWQRVSAYGKLQEPSERSFAWYWQKGCAATFSPSRVEVQESKGFLGGLARARDHALEVFEPSGTSEDSFADARVLLKAILLGDRRDLFASDLYTAMKTIGLAHIVAVSGAHLVMVTGFTILAFQALGVPKRLCIPFQLAVIVVYACITGLPVSVLRAAVMSVCALSAFYARRASSSISALSLCVVGMICMNPFLAVSISLAMSACASLGIILLSPGIGKMICALIGNRFRMLRDALSVCFAANALTLPISVSTFGQMPLVAPISNVLAVPIFPFLVCYGSVVILLSFVLPGFASAACLPLLLVAQAFCFVSRLLAGVPFACIPADGSIVSLGLIAGLGAVAFLFALKRVPAERLAMVVLAGLLFIASTAAIKPHLKGDELIACDVGQGDAIIIRSGARAMLVDTGTNDADLLAALSRHGIRKLDAVLITHPDDDHCGSLPALLSVVPVDCVCVAEGLKSLDKDNADKLFKAIGGRDLVEFKAGDSFSMGSFSMRVLSPERLADEGGNSDSLVVEAVADVDDDGVGDWSILLTGDAEADILESLHDTGALPDIDIFKVPHHGSKGAVNEGVLSVLKPEISLISVGEGNRYGHPSSKVVAMLEESGSRVFRTDQSGDVVCKLSARDVSVKCLK